MASQRKTQEKDKRKKTQEQTRQQTRKHKTETKGTRTCSCMQLANAEKKLLIVQWPQREKEKEQRKHTNKRRNEKTTNKEEAIDYEFKTYAIR